MRITEIMTDFRNLQYYISQIQANPAPEDYYLEGYTLLRSVVTEAQAVLASPYSYGAGAHPRGDAETEKAQLRAYVPEAAQVPQELFTSRLATHAPVLCARAVD
jgi:hypothetical protein